MINSILCNIAHRPYELPPGNWRYYQEWNDAVFLHWEIPYDILGALVAAALFVHPQTVRYRMSQLRELFPGLGSPHRVLELTLAVGLRAG